MRPPHAIGEIPGQVCDIRAPEREGDVAGQDLQKQNDVGILVIEQDALVDFDAAFANELPHLYRVLADFGSWQKPCRPQGRNRGHILQCGAEPGHEPYLSIDPVC